MTTAQEKFLKRIKSSLSWSLLPAAAPDHPGSFQNYSYQADAPLPDLIRAFTRELEALSGHVYVTGDTEEVIEIILQILAGHGAERILTWDQPELNLPGLDKALGEAGVVREDSHLPARGSVRQARLDRLDQVTVGLTGAQGGLADTGAIALISGPGRGRLASLLPPVHIALLAADRLYPALPAFLSAQPTAATIGSNLVFIAGPSRSGDIEMTLSMGVHGPKEVHVIITT
jgi:L-lactate dehydrogenase complex protein LldG